MLLKLISQYFVFNKYSCIKALQAEIYSLLTTWRICMDNPLELMAALSTNPPPPTHPLSPKPTTMQICFGLCHTREHTPAQAPRLDSPLPLNLLFFPSSAEQELCDLTFGNAAYVKIFLY